MILWEFANGASVLIEWQEAFHSRRTKEVVRCVFRQGGACQNAKSNHPAFRCKRKREFLGGATPCESCFSSDSLDALLGRKTTFFCVSVSGNEWFQPLRATLKAMEVYDGGLMQPHHV